MYKTHERERLTTEMIELGRLLHSSGVFRARSGNLSVRLADGTLLISRSATHKGLLNASDFIHLDPDGAPLEAGLASSETPLHVAAYRASPEIGAVLHAHPLACTALAHQGLPLNIALAEEGPAALGKPPLIAETSPQDRIIDWQQAVSQGTRAALLARHGLIVAGQDLRDVLCKVELCEWLAELQQRLPALSGTMHHG